ncbi:MAG TPA: dipeptidase [Elusimicrobia bacterium]|nr:MAG: dipeptidase [Elusimicrobia bacterium GWA2_66_18]OGR70891.1 MAG: dipeptidase [Elusimicrobia bacterium GWC2_65_9]HAZ08852.1 dipeptidase [Elusimicrobiota bacterium]
MDTLRAVSYAEQHFSDFLEELKVLSRIPSVSFPGFDPKEVERSAVAVATLCRARGLENVEILRLPGAHPYVYADWLHAPGKPTLLLYAHHDVQPAGRVELWKSPPFEPTERGGRLYGRGTADDKAGAVAHTSAISAWLKTHGALPVNVKLIIEGEEECGSDNLEPFLAKYADQVMADAIVLTDTGNFDHDTPSITVALRGLVALDVTVRSMDHPLHSGMWGGPLPDPVQALAKMIASCTDAKGRMMIPGIYQGVKKPAKAMEASLKVLKLTEKTFRAQSGLFNKTKLLATPKDILRSNWYRPAFSVNAIQASSKKDCANIINDSAWCHLGIRLVPGMDAKKSLEALQKHLKKNAPWGVQVEFSGESASPAWTTDTDAPAFAAARRALEKGYGRASVDIGCGGSIPFVGPFAQALKGAPALMIGVEDPLSNPHSENESLHLGMFKKSISSAVHLYAEIAALDKVR